MSRPVTGSRAFFGGPPWWLVVAVPVGLVLALFILEAAGMPTAPAVLVLFVLVNQNHRDRNTPGRADRR